MKTFFPLLAFALAGCQPVPGGPALPTWIPKASTGVQLVSKTESHLDDVYTGLDFMWDLGERPLREVRCGGMVQSGGPATRHPRTSTLKVAFRVTTKGKATLKVELREKGHDGSSTTSTTQEIALDGGLGAIETPPLANPSTAKTLTLLRWKDGGSKRPAALVLTFR